MDNRIPLNYIWNHRAPIGYTVLGAPLLLEGGSLALTAISNPSEVKKKLLRAHQFFLSCFTQQPNEEINAFYKRLTVNVLFTSLVLTTAGGVMAAALFTLPYSLSIGAVLATVISLGNLYLNAEKIPLFLEKLRGCYTQRLGEEEEVARKRILKNILISILCGTIALGIGIGLGCLGLQIASGAVSLWNPYSLLPMQTPLVVFLEYALLGVVHFAVAIHAFRKGENKKGFFHLLNGVLGFVFPSLMLAFSAPEEIRLHHSFIGLALALIPFRPVQMLASLISIDSLVNVFFFQYGSWRWGEYDFMNVLVEEQPGAVASTLASCALQKVSETFEPLPETA